MRRGAVSFTTYVIVVFVAGVSLVLAVLVVPPAMCLATLWIIGPLFLATAGLVALVKSAVSWMLGHRD